MVRQVNRFFRKPVKWLKIMSNGKILVVIHSICKFMGNLDRRKWEAFLHEKTPKNDVRLISRICG